MDEPKQESRRSRKSKSKISCFPSCFGRSGSVRDAKKSLGRRKSGWCFWRRFRNGKSGRKTVPLDAAVVDAATRGSDSCEEIKEEIVQEEATGMRQIPAAGCSVSDPGAIEKAPKAKSGSGKQQQQQEKKSLKTSSSSSSSIPIWKTESRKTGSPIITPSPSFSARKPTTSQIAGPSRPPNGRSSGQDVGLSVLMVVLTFLILWGRICAIICTSAWFYYTPRLRKPPATDSSAGKKLVDGGHIDVDSSEHKKKVIMAGLLERSRRQ